MVETLITAMLRNQYEIGLKNRTFRENREKWEACYKSLQTGKAGRFYRTMPFVILPTDLIGYSEVTNHERFLIQASWRVRDKNSF